MQLTLSNYFEDFNAFNVTNSRCYKIQHIREPTGLFWSENSKESRNLICLESKLYRYVCPTVEKNTLYPLKTRGPFMYSQCFVYKLFCIDLLAINMTIIKVLSKKNRWINQRIKDPKEGRVKDDKESIPLFTIE